MKREEADRLIVMALAVIVRDDGKVLVMWEGDAPYHGCWVIPGGYVRMDETVEQAAVREIREEVGVEVAPQGFVGVYDDFIEGVDETSIHNVLIVFKAKILGGELNVTREAKEYAWLPPKNVMILSMPRIMKTILTDFASGG